MGYNQIWLEIDLKRVAENIKNLRRKAVSEKFMAVVKADGYGHGSVKIAETALNNGADCLGVARIGEALELRENGITAPILILGYTHPSETRILLEKNLTQTVFAKDIAYEYGKAAEKTGKKLKVHIKIDTGMGRLGIVSNDVVSGKDEIQEIVTLEGIEAEGIYTHFASSDSFEKSYTLNQIKFFNKLLLELEEDNISFPIKHAANSAGILEFEESHYDMVRAGISMYGLYPSSEVNKDVILKPAMELKCRVSQVKRVPEGFFVSYGSTYRTERETTLATLPVGYADGFNRYFSGNGEMIVKGERVKIAGRVCMDQTVLDVGDLNVSIDDEVVVFGEQNGSELSIDEFAENLGTINYEVVTTIMKRVKRVYK